MDDRMDISINCSEYTCKEITDITLAITPVCCHFCDSDFNNIGCNNAALKLFDLKNKEEFIEKNEKLLPFYQPDGSISKVNYIEKMKTAMETGMAKFEWMYQNLNGELISTDVTIKRINCKDSCLLVFYTSDLREIKHTIEKMREANERTQIMLDATPLCSNFWNDTFTNIDCNQEAVNLFELNNKQEYLDRFFDLSPEYQPDGRLSSEKAIEKITKAFKTGKTVFEWMHQKLNKEPIPTEVTLVRVKYGEKYIVAGYTRDLRELKDTINSLNKIESIAFRDSLTGAYNRHYFLEFAQHEFNEYIYHKKPISIILFDLDKFKNINDNYGHLAGDEILKAVCSEIQKSLRNSDLLIRYGGEEFIIFGLDFDNETAVKLAWRLRDKIANGKFSFMDKEIPVTLSFGVATKTDPETTLNELISQADSAMYKAKRNGRNRVESYNDN